MVRHAGALALHASSTSGPCQVRLRPAPDGAVGHGAAARAGRPLGGSRRAGGSVGVRSRGGRGAALLGGPVLPRSPAGSTSSSSAISCPSTRSSSCGLLPGLSDGAEAAGWAPGGCAWWPAARCWPPSPSSPSIGVPTRWSPLRNGSTATCPRAARSSPPTGTRAFPCRLPGGQPDQYQVHDFPYYDPDTPEKLASPSARAARGAHRLRRLPHQADLRRDHGRSGALPPDGPLPAAALRRRPRLPPRPTATARRSAAGPRGPRRAGRRVLHGLRPPEGRRVREAAGAVDRGAAVEARGRHERPSRLAATCCLAGSAGNAWLGLAWAREPVRDEPPRAALVRGGPGAARARRLGRAPAVPCRALGGQAAAKGVGVLAFAFGAWLLAYLWPGSFDGPFLTGLFGLSVLLAMASVAARAGRAGRVRCDGRRRPSSGAASRSSSLCAPGTRRSTGARSPWTSPS